MHIGIDVGGTHIGIGIIDENYNLIIKEEKDYETRQEKMEPIVIDTIKELTNKLLEEKNIDIKDITSIGIAFPGTVSNRSGYKS